uniref:uncharacterized protein LOC120346281 n=1 Tax=Styela clava TaxID=7725 RepID=UPI0019396DE6|nr:uncharacterized protein LOC120346281 [Styela clava]
MLKQQLEDQKKTLRWILRDKCISKIEHACYFTVVHSRTQVNYKTAVEICKDRGADIGVIRDNDSYTEIMNDLRFKMPRGTFYNDVWTGLGFNPFTGEITPANSFTEWINEKPYMGVLTRDYTNVFLHVNRNPAHWKQGMRNVKPNEHFYGVVCEIKL